MDFTPNGSWVLLPDPSKTKTKSGIYLDEETARNSGTNILKVIAAGPHCEFCKTGDVVMIDPRTEAVIAEIEKETYLMVGEHQLLGKWNTMSTQEYKKLNGQK